MGYHQAGFEVVGVDLEKQKRYPFEFIQSDAIDYLIANAHKFDAVHASPPCERFSTMTPKAYRANHPDLIKATRYFCKKKNKLFVIENVEGARKELVNPVKLCGSMFGLPIFRHRYFETNFLLVEPAQCKHDFTPILMTGRGMRIIDGKRASERKKEEVGQASGINWMSRDELNHAIPPAYTKYIGEKLLTHLHNAKVFL